MTFVRSFGIACCCIAFSGFATAEDWSQWRGPERSNRSNETGLFKTWTDAGPPLVWMESGAGSGYAGVSVVGKHLYTTGNFDDGQAVTCFDTESGKRVWKTSVTDKPPKHGYDGSRSTPTVDGDLLYVVPSDGRIVCLQAADGKEVWSRPFSDWNGKMMSGWGFSESPLVDGDKVICTPGGAGGLVVALNKKTGESIWACEGSELDRESSGKKTNDGAGYSSVVISNAGGIRQYVQLIGPGLVGIHAETGKLLWQYDRVANTTANIPTPLVAGDYVFTSTGYNTGAALLKLVKDGANQFKTEEVYWLDGREFQNKHGGMTYHDGFIYCGHGNGNGLPICLNVRDGEIAWGPERAEGKGETSMIYADGHFVLRRESGHVILIKANPEKYDVVGSFMPEFQEGKSWAHPVISNGKLYLRENDKIMAYQL